MAITNARMQIKRGNEVDFDSEKMLVGEWALSTDKKIVRICVAPNVCIRMATYDAFEVDMAKIEKILEECQTIEDAVKLINSQVSEKLQATIEYTNQAKQYRDEAEQFRNEVEQFAPDGYVELKETVASNTIKIDTIIEKAELNIKNSASGENLHLTDSANGKNVGFGLYGKATQDGEPTPDNPIEITVSGSDGSVEIVSCRKNLLKNGASTRTESGVTFTINTDGSIALSGTSTKGIQFNINSNLEQYLINGAYKLSGGNIGVSEIYLSVKKTNNTIYSVTNSVLEKGFSVTDDTKATLAYIWINSGVVCDNVTLYPMIRKASDTDDTWEPYTETTSTIPTPDGLAGIKVSSGGNYTDENGQQWICDEVVKYADGSGNRIQRVGKAVFDGSDDEGWVSEGTNTTDKYRKRSSYLSEIIKKTSTTSDIFNGLCSAFKTVPSGGLGTYGAKTGMSVGMNGNIQVYSDSYNTTDTSLWTSYLAENPMTLYYELAEPIITDLTAEEIAEIEKLHTFYPITNISNDAECGMSITYLADSKNYIDGQLAIQKAQQEEALATMLLLMPEEVQASMIENDTNNLLNESEV